MFLIKFGKFLATISLKYAFFPFLSLLSFWNSHYAYFDMSDGIPQVSEALLISLLFFGPDNLN